MCLLLAVAVKPEKVQSRASTVKVHLQSESCLTVAANLF